MQTGRKADFMSKGSSPPSSRPRQHELWRQSATDDGPMFESSPKQKPGDPEDESSRDPELPPFADGYDGAAERARDKERDGFDPKSFEAAVRAADN